MALKAFKKFDNSGKSFNMTPIIDIVFLLIIFFMVISHFIEAENFPLQVPDNCDSAISEPPQTQVTTLTIMKNQDGIVEFALGSQKVIYTNSSDLVEKLTSLINAQTKDLPPKKRIIALRADKDIPYAQSQYALAAIANSIATDIQLTVLKQKR